MTGAARLAAASLSVASLIAATPARSQQPIRFQEAVTQAVRAAAAVDLAALRVKEAEARAGQARAALLPGLSGSAFDSDRTFNLKSLGISFPTIPGSGGLPDLQGPVESVDARVRATATVLDLSSLLRVRAAGQGVRASQADREVAAELAAENAAIAYLRAARAQALVGARVGDARIAAELLELAEARQQAGTAPAIDTTRARTELVAAQGALLVARNQADRALIELARALGADPASPPALADTLSESLGDSPAPAEPATATAFALERRPELGAERAVRARARAERSAISAERLPRLDASVDWGVSGADWAEAFPTHQYSLAVTVPLLDGFRRESRLAEQSSQVRESEVRERDLHDRIAAEVRAALLDVTSGRDQLGVAEERLRLAEEELSQARDRFVNGVAGNIEIINAQSSLVRARDAAIDARFTIGASRVAAAHAAGVARALR